MQSTNRGRKRKRGSRSERRAKLIARAVKEGEKFAAEQERTRKASSEWVALLCSTVDALLASVDEMEVEMSNPKSPFRKVLCHNQVCDVGNELVNLRGYTACLMVTNPLGLSLPSAVQLAQEAYAASRKK